MGISIAQGAAVLVVVYAVAPQLGQLEAEARCCEGLTRRGEPPGRSFEAGVRRSSDIWRFSAIHA
jgi:hypothetical protein